MYDFSIIILFYRIIRKETKRNVRNHDSKHTKSNLSQRYVQTQGVFSEGSGEIRPSMGLSENLSSSRQQETLRAPKIRKTSLIVSDSDIFFYIILILFIR